MKFMKMVIFHMKIMKMNISYEMAIDIGFCLSLDHFKLDFISFTVNIIYFNRESIIDTNITKTFHLCNIWSYNFHYMIFIYRKIPKFSDTRKLCCNLPRIQEKRPDLWVFRQKDANGIANSGDPDQTAPLHCLPRPMCPKT